MSSPLILIVGVVYLLVSLDQLRKGDVGMSIAWFGYFIGNIGLAMACK